MFSIGGKEGRLSRAGGRFFFRCQGRVKRSVGRSVCGRSVPLFFVALLDEIGFADAVAPGKRAQRRPLLVLSPNRLPVCHFAHLLVYEHVHIMSIAHSFEDCKKRANGKGKESKKKRLLSTQRKTGARDGEDYSAQGHTCPHMLAALARYILPSCSWKPTMCIGQASFIASTMGPKPSGTSYATTSTLFSPEKSTVKSASDGFSGLT